MQIDIQIEGDAADRIRELSEGPLQSARRIMVQEAMVQCLQATIAGNPVDTARSRAAWVQPLEQLGGSPPSGWEGPHPTAVEEGRRLGQLIQQESDQASTVSASNGVRYIGYLEYGTSRMAAVAMVRRSLLQVRSALAGLFRLG
ncbi:hypothetical protein [Planctomicrobium piriforme]|uniref:Uncharacterized protein n=1 Tax=Planctomicrobium piriforme TaxID=1576369 RepID=A0A1I3C1X3_9PLAN|nr:hypothetical protein [Planctomicrobium piriforme]SFH68502.1 hypothetical protein SAMN05421753_10250 [Planctomicrobium piriforme]